MQIAASIILVLMFVLATPAAVASDEGDLKAAFLKAMDELRDKDLEGFLSFWHPEAVFLARDRLFALDRAASEYDKWAADVDQFFAKTISAEMIPVDVNYRVLGDMGILWGRARFAVDPVGGGGSDFDSRLTVTLLKTSGKWQIVTWHASASPMGRSVIP
jgi:ketosteroid isomerase-like protein